MCGINGIIHFKEQAVEEQSVRKMMAIQKHRGPDDEGVFIEENVGLGFVRLSILDLSPAGHQPMLSSDGRYVLIFNGEIFNYIELKNELENLGHSFKTSTDTEVLLAAYIQWGQECLHKFNGMWAFAIYDRKTKNIFASRDRYGIKPFYYYLSDSLFAFASEIPPLLKILKNKPTPDYQTIFDYLIFSRTDQTERTFFNEIKKLQHGQQLSLSGSVIKITKWYDLKKRVFLAKGFVSPKEYRRYFKSSVELRLRSDVPVGVCLSGGLDSSSITSVLYKDLKKKNINTFSAIYKEGQYGNESCFIDSYKKSLKNMTYTHPDGFSLKKDLEYFIDIHAEPIPSTGPYAQYKVMELAKEHVVVTLDGQGADEQLAGYHYFYGFYFKDLLIKGRLHKLLKEIYYYLRYHKSMYGLKTFAFFMLPKALRTKARMGEKGYLNRDFKNKYKNKNAIAGNLYNASSLKGSLIDHFEYKLEHLLKWEDRNSMAFSLESRVPYLDYRLVEKTLATDSDHIIHKGITKHILRQSMKDTVPEKIRMRMDKIGFDTPQGEWFREESWQNIIKDILKSKSFKQRKIIDPDIALRKFNKHLNGKINISKEIWKWINLELWFRKFID